MSDGPGKPVSAFASSPEPAAFDDVAVLVDDDPTVALPRTRPPSLEPTPPARRSSPSLSSFSAAPASGSGRVSVPVPPRPASKSRPDFPSTTTTAPLVVTPIVGDGDETLPTARARPRPSAVAPEEANVGANVGGFRENVASDRKPGTHTKEDSEYSEANHLRIQSHSSFSESHLGESQSAGHAAGVDLDDEQGWTPYQPPVAERQVSLVADRPSVEIPIDTEEDDEDDEATNPQLPLVREVEQFRLAQAARAADAVDVAELDSDDLVSIEAVAKRHGPQAPPPPLKSSGRPVAVSVPPASYAPEGGAIPGALTLSGVGPLAPLAAPFDSPVGTKVAPGQSPGAASPPPHVVVSLAPPSKSVSLPAPPPSEPNLGPAAGTPMARRPQPEGGPFGVAPPQALLATAAFAPPPMTDTAANRRKVRPWWEDLFNDDFIRTMAKVPDALIAREVNFIEESLGCDAGATILDLACGTGRHAVELAARGYKVVGFDLSLAMLARASDEAQERDQKINFVQGDMREMTFDETFDGVFSWNTSFGFFDEEKNATVVAKVHRALKKGGQFLLDVINRDHVIRTSPSLAWFEGDGCICMDQMQIDFITSRMRVKRTLMIDDGRTKEIEYSVRVYSLHELGKLLHDNGFRVAEVSGRTGTPGAFFGCESPRTLILAEKR